MDKKIKIIHELELKIDNQKFGFDSTTYNQYLQKRLKDTLEETNRHFDNYIQVRNTHHDLLEERALKKRGKKVANDSDLLNLKKSLKKHIQIHKDEVKRIHELYSEYDKFHKPIEKQLVNQGTQIKRLEAELERKSVMVDKKEKHFKRLFTKHESLKDASKKLIDSLKLKYPNVVSDTQCNEVLGQIYKLVNNIEV